MPDQLTITTGARLHFGLIRFGTRTGRQFGGIGAMITRPQLRLVARAADQFAIEGRLGERVARFAEGWGRFHERQALPPIVLRVEESPPEHVGLGLGTQLGLAVARVLERCTKLAVRSAAETAHSVGRGKRSAIGVHGFEHGGLIYESGKLPGETISPLAARVALPEEWRFLLLRPRASSPGLAGESESQAFEQMPPVPDAVASRLVELAEQEIVPAARAADFARFSAAVGEYNELSGSCYKTSQGGAFASPEAAAVVARLKADGIAGVGQSSWGPTLFALLPDDAAASAALDRYYELPNWQLEITLPRNSPAECVAER